MHKLAGFLIWRTKDYHIIVIVVCSLQMGQISVDDTYMTHIIYSNETMKYISYPDENEIFSIALSLSNYLSLINLLKSPWQRLCRSLQSRWPGRREWDLGEDFNFQLGSNTWDSICSIPFKEPNYANGMNERVNGLQCLQETGDDKTTMNVYWTLFVMQIASLREAWNVIHSNWNDVHVVHWRQK